MKRNCIIYLLILMSTSIYSQSDCRFSQNVPSGDVIYYNKSRGEGGRAFVHSPQNELVINYANDFTGGVKIGANAWFKDNNAPFQFEIDGAIRTDSLTLGRQGTGISGTIKRLTIVPYRHTGRWYVNARDDNSLACLDLDYGSTNLFTVQHKGKVGILTKNPQYTLEVNGTIRSKEIKIEATGWSDFVFEPDYKLPCLSDVEKHIKENKHLPDIPSEKEVLENGVNVVEMQAKLLQKIEELTLYVIQQQKELEEVKSTNTNQAETIKQLLETLK